MSRSLVPTWQQKERLEQLLRDLGVGPYRDVKAELGIGRMKPFQRLTYTQAMQIIGLMESLKTERFSGQNECMFDACSHQPQPPQPESTGLPEPAAERSKR